ncbi:hypothetical protein GCM10017708_13570 [Arthrobacter citreus]
MVKGQDVHPAGKGGKGFKVGVVPDGGGGNSRHCRNIRAFSQDTQFETKCHCRGGHHPGQLATANDANYR